jgi:hypothetical protein
MMIKRYVIILIPLVFLLFSIFNLPIFVPDFLLVNRYYVARDSSSDIPYFYELAKKYKKITIVDSNSTFTFSFKDYDSIDSFRNDFSSRFQGKIQNNFYDFLAKVKADLSWWEKPVILLTSYPSTEEIFFLKQFNKSYSIPFSFILLNKQSLIASYSARFYLEEKNMQFQVLFSPEIYRFDDIKIDKINKDGSHVQITQEQVAKISLSNYLIEFPIQGNEDEQFTLEFIFSNKEIKEPQISAINISTSSFKTKNVLVVSDNIKNNFFDSILRTKKVSLKDADKESLIDYKLIFFEGIPIKKIPLSLSSNIVNAYNKDNLGVFFVSEGKDIGKTGDNEIIETILPIELTPRSLKEVPDVAILVMLDTSSSMLGEKLAIAKISANQLLSQLKGNDLVSFYTFWDSYEELFPFTRLSNIKKTFSISKVEAMGGTDLYIALKDGLSKLAKQPVENRHTIIISDFQTKPSNWDSLLSFAVSNDISISVIQIGTEVDSALANKIAKTTKGNAYMATSFEAIPTILFEDRKRISRPPFKNQKFKIFDAYDDFVGSVSGMNLATPKKDSQTILKNEQSDPLFIFIKNGSKNSGFFLSDSYGFYTREILSNNYVVGLFRSYFESQIENMIEKYIIIENSNEFILLINNPMLYEPVAYIYDEQMPVLSKQMTKKAGGYFALEATMIPAGEYRLIISDSGKTYLQVPISINKNLGARNYQSSLAFNSLKKVHFKKIPSNAIYLILFFLFSCFVTYYIRIKRS